MISHFIQDTSLPIDSEKSPLPSIIVTPPPNIAPAPDDSPFYIAFLAPPRKPSLLERIGTRLPSVTGRFNARTAIILLVLVFIMTCHVLTHRLAACRPRLDLLGGCSISGSAQVSQSALEWLDFLDFTSHDTKREFIVTDTIL